MDYPASFDKFFNAVLSKGKSKRKYACITLTATKDGDDIIVTIDYGDGFIKQFGKYDRYQKENLYCDCLDCYLFPRVKE